MANSGRPLFTGRDIEDQLKCIFKILGECDEESWPGISSLPDYKTYYKTWNFTSSITLSQLVPKLNPKGKDLLQQLIVCNPSERISADNALNHSFFLDD